MHVPRMRDRVRIAGRAGLFLVLWVDEENQRASVVSLSRVSAVAQNVPFLDIQQYEGDISTEAV